MIELVIERGLVEGMIEVVERGAREMDVDGGEDDEGEVMMEMVVVMVYSDGLMICDVFKMKRYVYDL